MKTMKKGFTLVELLVVIGILGILMGALFPAISSAMVKANLSAVSMKGRNLFVAITAANTEREAIGLGNCWPHTTAQDGTDSNTDKIGGGTATCVDYFKALFDVDNMGQDTHKPYISGVDLSVLSGAGVSPASSPTALTSKNILWAVAANVTDEMDDVIPVLLSRNVATDELKTDTYDGTLNTEISLGTGTYKTPFGNKAFVAVRKGGSVVSQTSKYATLQVIYNKTAFKIDSDPNAQFQYLKVE